MSKPESKLFYIADDLSGEKDEIGWAESYAAAGTDEIERFLAKRQAKRAAFCNYLSAHGFIDPSEI